MQFALIFIHEIKGIAIHSLLDFSQVGTLVLLRSLSNPVNARPPLLHPDITFHAHTFKQPCSESLEILISILNRLRMTSDGAVGRREMKDRFAGFLAHRYQAAIMP